MDWFGFSQEPPTDWFGFPQENTLFQFVDFKSNSMTVWKPPPPGGPPLWVSFAKQGFYGFKPTICALCCSNTHEILQCPKREYFSAYVQTHIHMRNDSKRHWNNPCSESYNPKLKEYLEQYFEQFNVSQELSVEEKLSKLLELTELYIERANQGFQIQALNCGKCFDNQEETILGETTLRRGESTLYFRELLRIQIYFQGVFFPCF